MIKIIDFKTQAEAELIIGEKINAGWTLQEVQNHFDGNHLVFDDNKSPRDLAAEIDQLKADIEALKAKTEVK